MTSAAFFRSAHPRTTRYGIIMQSRKAKYCAPGGGAAPDVAQAQGDEGAAMNVANVIDAKRPL